MRGMVSKAMWLEHATNDLEVMVQIPVVPIRNLGMFVYLTLLNHSCVCLTLKELLV